MRKKKISFFVIIIKQKCVRCFLFLLVFECILECDRITWFNNKFQIARKSNCCFSLGRSFKNWARSCGAICKIQIHRFAFGKIDKPDYILPLKMPSDLLSSPVQTQQFSNWSFTIDPPRLICRRSYIDDRRKLRSRWWRKNNYPKKNPVEKCGDSHRPADAERGKCIHFANSNLLNWDYT